ncbi:hypothetical protein [Butyribacter intestini]|uniref:hypothetical protein n=1 Tax=Butyribacter intestini TaxID=1703332 RepID=UPI003AB8F121
MTKYCIKCGNPCPDDALVCPRCGEMLQRNAAPGNNIKKANNVPVYQGGVAAKKTGFEKRKTKIMIVVAALIVIILGYGYWYIFHSLNGRWYGMYQNEYFKYDIGFQLVIHGKKVDMAEYRDGKRKEIFDEDQYDNVNIKLRSVTNNKIRIRATAENIKYGQESEAYNYWYRRRGFKLYLYNKECDYDKDEPWIVLNRKLF